METMTINANTLACDLAEKKLVEIFKQQYPNLSDDEFDDIILVEDDETTIYSVEAQELFNRLYNEYYCLIEAYKI